MKKSTDIENEKWTKKRKRRGVELGNNTQNIPFNNQIGTDGHKSWGIFTNDLTKNHSLRKTPFASVRLQNKIYQFDK